MKAVNWFKESARGTVFVLGFVVTVLLLPGASTATTIPEWDRVYGGYRQPRGRDSGIMDRRAYRRHEKAARKAWQQWYSQQRRMVGPAYNGHRAPRQIPAPRIALRLMFHL